METIDKMEEVYSAYNMQKYKEIKDKLMGLVAETWGIDKTALNLAAPTFFSKLTNKPPVTMNDQYWHKHVDTLQYRVFHYTGLIIWPTMELTLMVADSFSTKLTKRARNGNRTVWTTSK